MPEFRYVIFPNPKIDMGPGLQNIPIDHTLPDPLPPFDVSTCEEMEIYNTINSIYPNTSVGFGDKIMLRWEKMEDAPAKLPARLGGNELVGEVGSEVFDYLTGRVKVLKDDAILTIAEDGSEEYQGHKVLIGGRP